MSAALDHCWELLRQIALDDDPDLYPAQLFAAPVDTDNLPRQAVEHLDKGATVLVMLDDASQYRFTPEPASRLRRRLDRLRGRIRVRVEERPVHGASRVWHAARSREAFERELVPGGLLPA